MSETLSWSPTVVSRPPTSVPPAIPTSHDHDALIAGTRLDEFEIIRVLGAGGFGIVYLALDHVLLRYVAIKEYMPSALASRRGPESVVVRSSHHAETFALGLESFFSEARMLASFDHPSLVKVYRFWKANGTAYMAMQYYAGQTLKDARSEMGSSPDEAWLRAFVEPILGALEVLHGEGVYHRDIAPDNILLLPDGRPVLLDFGSARRVIGDRTQSLTAILKPNFAPVEQYADDPGMRQGPWTDLYALGATMHFMLTGVAPVPAVMRAVRDSMPVLSRCDAGTYPGVTIEFLAIIDWTLGLAPQDRPQSVSTLLQAMRGEVSPPPAVRIEPLRDASAFAPQPSAHSTTSAASHSAPMPPMPALSSPLPPRSSGFFKKRTPALLAATAVLCLLAWASSWLLGNSAPAPIAASTTSTKPALVDDASVREAADIKPQTPTPAAVLPAAPVSPDKPRAATVHRETTLPSSTTGHIDVQRARPSGSPAVVALSPRQATQSGPTVGVNSQQAAPSPRERCGDLNFIALAVCMSRRCQEAEFQAHPQCVESRRFDEQRRRRADQ